MTDDRASDWSDNKFNNKLFHIKLYFFHKVFKLSVPMNVIIMYAHTERCSYFMAIGTKNLPHLL